MFSEDGQLVWAAQYRSWGAVKHIWQADNDNDAYHAPNPSPASLMRGNLAIRYDNVAEQRSHEAALNCPIRFQGQWEDPESGLYYNRHRYYDPLVGQYMSPDPLGIAGGLRPNAYVHNPNTYTDPLGLQSLDASGYTLYHIVDRGGAVRYVGITNDIFSRTIAHQNSGRLAVGFDLVPSERNLTYAQARGYEQADIKHYNALQLDERGQPIKPGSGNRQLSFAENRNDPRATEFRKYEAERTQHHGRTAMASVGKSGPK